MIFEKYRNSPEVLSIFVEADKFNGPRSPDLPADFEPEENDEFSGYEASAEAITDRLELMGFTAAAARADFALMIKNEINDTSELAHESAMDQELDARLRAERDARIAFLSDFSFDAWVTTVTKIRVDNVHLKTYDAEARELVFSRPLNSLEAFILNEKNDDEQPPLGYFCSDLRFLISAYLLSAGPQDLVVLDNSEVVYAGYFTAEDRIVQEARQSIAAKGRAIEKLLVLTEGSSDSRILQCTFDVLYPHLKEFVSFLDHGQFSVAGGAGNLMNLLRGFAGAGVSNRVVALFDNDAAGTVQRLKAKAMPLPRNFRVIQLPHLTWAERYPTLGPTGLVEADINGLACSIELYLGMSALEDETSGLIPIQWTGIERSLSRYQGELLDKRAVQDRYFDLLRAGRADTSEMDGVFRHILRSFHERDRISCVSAITGHHETVTKEITRRDSHRK
ncbi:MAG: HEPN/Toprim-associated domain-containing protein [Acidobacteriota bacterium]|nr:HEPN/Toprim-associated domain-containing protein [Acidobacteriota bacterium]